MVAQSSKHECSSKRGEAASSEDYDSASETTQCHFCHTVLVETVTRQPESRREELILTRS